MFKKVINTFGAIVGLGFLGLIAFQNYQVKPQPHFVGSVQQGSEYHATTSTATGLNGNFVAFTGSGVLGSVVITSSTAVTITILDTNGITTTTVAAFKPSTAAGTYTFDTVLYKGLVVQTSGSSADGSFVVTYRQN